MKVWEKKEFCDETDLQKKSDHYHDACSYDRGGRIPELLKSKEGSCGSRGVRGRGMMDISDADILAENQAKNGEMMENLGNCRP